MLVINGICDKKICKIDTNHLLEFNIANGGEQSEHRILTYGINIKTHQVTKRFSHGDRHFQKIYGGLRWSMDP